GDVVAVERERPARDRVLAGHRTQQRGLANAVAAEHTGHLARLRRQRDATQGLRCAVVEIDVFYDQHRQPFANSEWRVANSQKKYSIRYSLLAIRLSTQINLNHPLVRGDLIDGPFRQYRAFMQAGDLDAEFAH